MAKKSMGASPNRAEALVGKKRKDSGDLEDLMPHAGKQGGKVGNNGKNKKSRKGKGEASSFADAMAEAMNKQAPPKSTGPIMPAAKDKKQLEQRQAEDKKEKEAAKLVVAKQKWFQKEHIVPDPAEGNYEKMLLKLATRGVVKLFNAVQTQQKQRNEEKGRDVVAPKPDKLTKGQFLDILKSKKDSGAADAHPEQEKGAAKRDEHEEEEVRPPSLVMLSLFLVSD
eukprot:2678975-Rhodomonas_salina.1